MLSRLFIPKTLLDQGGIYARSLPDHPNQWTLQSYERHGLTGTLVGEPTEKDQFLYVDLKFTNAEFQSKLKDAFPNLQVLPDGSLRIETEAIFQAVADKCREQLSTLPSDFFPTSAEEDTEVEVSLADTESETVTSERSGQQLYRTRLEEIWGGRCAVTGVEVPEVLRASHAKPWKDCETGNERLDGYNGFLLSANLDALFDKFLISFADDGKILISPYLKAEELKALGVTPEMKLRFVDSRHLPYLEYQRNQFLKRIGNGNVIKDENS